MCSLNRTLSLSVFPREPAASLDATVDYVKVGKTDVLQQLKLLRMIVLSVEVYDPVFKFSCYLFILN